jgi:hypothetical protein
MIIAVCLIMAANCLHARKIVIYPVPQQLYDAMHNDDFTVQVREPDGVWQDLYEYKVKVDMDTRSDKPEDISVECNGDRLHNLHVFTDPVETSRPDKRDVFCRGTSRAER